MRTTGPVIGAFLTALREQRVLGIRGADGRVVCRSLYVVVDRQQVLKLDLSMHDAPAVVLSPACNARVSFVDGQLVVGHRYDDPFFARDPQSQLAAVRTEISTSKATIRRANIVNWAESLPPSSRAVDAIVAGELQKRVKKLTARGFAVAVVDAEAPGAPYATYAAYGDAVASPPAAAATPAAAAAAAASSSSSSSSKRKARSVGGADNCGFPTHIADLLRKKPVDVVAPSLRGRAMYERLLRAGLARGAKTWGTLKHVLHSIVVGADTGQVDWLALVGGMFRAPDNRSDDAAIQAALEIVQQRLPAGAPINDATPLSTDVVRAVLEGLDLVWITGVVHGKAMDVAAPRVSAAGAAAAQLRADVAATTGCACSTWRTLTECARRWKTRRLCCAATHSSAPTSASRRRSAPTTSATSARRRRRRRVWRGGWSTHSASRSATATCGAACCCLPATRRGRPASGARAIRRRRPSGSSSRWAASSRRSSSTST